MVTFVVCFVFFVVFPVAGPRYMEFPTPLPTDRGFFRPLVLWVLERGSSRGTAFPSSHVAVALTQSVLAIRYFGPRGAIVAALSIGLAIGAVYGGFHYFIDVMAGAAIGAVTTYVALRVWRTAHANATAPT